MKIPKEFQLFGQVIRVEFDHKLNFEENCIGQCRYRENKILLCPSTKDYPISKDQQLQTFFHELVHYMFFLLNENELRDNEKIVDQLGHLIQQFHKTKKS